MTTMMNNANWDDDDRSLAGLSWRIPRSKSVDSFKSFIPINKILKDYITSEYERMYTTKSPRHEYSDGDGCDQESVGSWEPSLEDEYSYISSSCSSVEDDVDVGEDDDACNAMPLEDKAAPISHKGNTMNIDMNTIMDDEIYKKFSYM